MGGDQIGQDAGRGRDPFVDGQGRVRHAPAARGVGLANGVFGGLDDAVHHLHRLDGIAPGGRLGGQHHRVRAIQDGVGHVGGLGPGGARIAHHRFQHLGGGDHRLAPLVAGGDQAFLDGGHFFGRHLDPQVAPGHHDAVGRIDDGVDVLQGLGLFDLGDDGRLIGQGGQVFPHASDVVRMPHEGHGDEIHLFLHSEGRILEILLGDGGHRQRGPWNVDPLVVLQHPPDDHLAAHLRAFHLADAQHDQPIVQEHRLPGADIRREPVMGGGNDPGVALHLAGGDGEGRSGFQQGLPFGEASHAHLGALQVQHDAANPACGLRRPAHHGHRLAMKLMAAMG